MKTKDLIPDFYLGGNARVRQLCDGRFVAEIARGRWRPKWHGVDLKTPGRFWEPLSAYYRDCIGTREQCLTGLAVCGVSMTSPLTLFEGES